VHCEEEELPVYGRRWCRECVREANGLVRLGSEEVLRNCDVQKIVVEMGRHGCFKRSGRKGVEQMFLSVVPFVTHVNRQGLMVSSI